MEPLPTDDAARILRRIATAQNLAVNQAPKDEDPTTPPGVLGGGQTIRVPGGTGSAADDRWYQLYEFPVGSGQFLAFQYNNIAQVGAATGQRNPAYTARSQTWFNQKVLGEAPAEQVIGLRGNFQGMMREIMVDAAAAAGVRDPSLAGRLASDPEMQRIMAQATIGDWTPEQIRAEQRNTNFWKNTLYPGIEAFYGRTADPERAWANYTGNVTPALVALGYKQGADGTYNTQINKMLKSGIDAGVFLENAPVFMQAVQSREFFNVLRQRSQAELGKDLKFGDWFSLLKGEAAPEIRQVAEGAVVAFQAQQAGVGIAEATLQRIIAERDLGEAEARNVFSEVNQAVLALGEIGLSRGGLTRDDIISSMADITSVGGRSPVEVRNLVAKLARENDLMDEEKLNFYVGFTPSGSPFRPGLTALAPEGA
jgi:hypothetical protein